MAKPSTTSRARVTDAALERRLERLGLTGKEEEWTDHYRESIEQCRLTKNSPDFV